MLGYGARLAYGCNIGAYFSGIASGSVHGWLWLVFAFIGNGLGVKLRPIFFPGEKPQPKTDWLLIKSPSLRWAFLAYYLQRSF